MRMLALSALGIAGSPGDRGGRLSRPAFCTFPIQVSHGCHSLHICLISEKKQKLKVKSLLSFLLFFKKKLEYQVFLKKGISKGYPKILRAVLNLNSFQNVNAAHFEKTSFERLAVDLPLIFNFVNLNYIFLILKLFFSSSEDGKHRPT